MIGALALSGCSNPKDMSSDSDGESSSSSSTTEDPTATASASASASASGTTTTTTTTTQGTTTMSSSTTDGPGCAPDPDFTCVAPYPCDGGACGGLEDRFDEGGCLRPACSEDQACTGGTVCYQPSMWGGCAGSVFSCADEGGTCSCFGSEDCGGAYCVPESLLPPTVPGPVGPARIDDACSPNDAPALELAIGLDSEEGACKAALSGASLRIALWYSGAPLEPGVYTLSDGAGAAWYDKEGDGDPLASDKGVLKIEAWDAEGVSGSYAVLVGGEAIVGSFAAAPYCASGALCG